MKRLLVSAVVIGAGLVVSFGCGTLHTVPLDPGLAVVALGFVISTALGVGAPSPPVLAAEAGAQQPAPARAA